VRGEDPKGPEWIVYTGPIKTLALALNMNIDQTLNELRKRLSEAIDSHLECGILSDKTKFYRARGSRVLDCIQLSKKLPAPKGIPDRGKKTPKKIEK